MSVNFLAVATTSIHSEESATLSSRLLEPLKVYDKNWGSLVEIHLLGSSHMILTFITVPFIIVIEHLRHSEMFKTILQGDFSSIFIHSSLLHFLLGSAHT